MRKYWPYPFVFLILLILPVLWEESGTSYRLALFVCLGLAWLLLRMKGRKDLALRMSGVVMMVFVGTQIALTFKMSSPSVGIDIVVNDLVLFLIFLFIYDSLDLGWNDKVWLDGFICIGILFGLIELTAVVNWYLKWGQISGSIFSQPPIGYRSPGVFFGHPNVTAGFMNLVIPIVLIRFLGSRSGISRLVWVIGLLPCLLTVYVTKSRGGWIGLASGVSVCLVLFYTPLLKRANKFLRERKLPNIIKGYLWAYAAVALVTMVGAIFFVNQILKAPHGSLAARWDIYQYAYKMIALSPLLGHGTGSYPFLNALRSSSIFDDYVYLHAHNLWLQIGVEMGVIGISMGLLFVGMLVWAFIEAWKQISVEGDQRGYLAAFAGVGVAVGMQNILDYLFSNLLYTLGVFLVIALMLKQDREHSGIRLSWQKASSLIAVLLGLGLFGMVFSMRGDTEFSRGLAAASRRDWEKASEQICYAADLNPSDSHYNFQCALANAYASYEDSDLDHLINALIYQKAGLAVDPNWYVHWANLATYEWKIGQQESAIEHMKRAAINSPRRALFWVNLGWMEEQIGNDTEAKEAYLNGLQFDPWLLEDEFFTSSPLRRAIHESQFSSNDWSLGLEALEDKNYSKADQEIALANRTYPYGSIPGISLALLRERVGKKAEALDIVQRDLFLNGETARALLIAARVLLDLDKPDDANLYLRSALKRIENTNYSFYYYKAAYHRDFLASDLSPYLLRLGWNVDILNLPELITVAGTVGRMDDSAVVLRWAEEAKNP